MQPLHLQNNPEGTLQRAVVKIDPLKILLFPVFADPRTIPPLQTNFNQYLLTGLLRNCQ